jgi:hypothetical protein
MLVEEQSVRAAGRIWLSAFGIIWSSFGLEGSNDVKMMLGGE